MIECTLCMLMLIIDSNDRKVILHGICSVDNNEVIIIINNVHEYVCEKGNESVFNQCIVLWKHSSRLLFSPICIVLSHRKKQKPSIVICSILKLKKDIEILFYVYPFAK
jgi:hypothetical protein